MHAPVGVLSPPDGVSPQIFHAFALNNRKRDLIIAKIFCKFVEINIACQIKLLNYALDTSLNYRLSVSNSYVYHLFNPICGGTCGVLPLRS